MAPWLTVVGIGEEGYAGLGKAARRALLAAEVIVGAPRQLQLLPRCIRAPQQTWPSPFSLDGLLALRGPQTAGELRLNAERWYRFADISSVEAFLDELQERSAEKGGALVLKLPRAPGAREQRWAHLLCGTVDVDSLGSSGASAQAGGLAQRVATLEAEVAHLRAALERVCAELGLPAPSKTDGAAPE